MKKKIIDQYEAEGEAIFCSARLWDDGIIDPRETRNYLGFALCIIYNKEIKGADSFGVWRM